MCSAFVNPFLRILVEKMLSASGESADGSLEVKQRQLVALRQIPEAPGHSSGRDGLADLGAARNLPGKERAVLGRVYHTLCRVPVRSPAILLKDGISLPSMTWKPVCLGLVNIQWAGNQSPWRTSPGRSAYPSRVSCSFFEREWTASYNLPDGFPAFPVPGT